MTNCERHGWSIVMPVCSHLRESVEGRIKPDEVFYYWFYSENREFLIWILPFCRECVKEYGFLPESRVFDDYDAESNLNQLQRRGDFTSVCGTCFNEVIGRINLQDPKL
jgi:hypothetical protein